MTNEQIVAHLDDLYQDPDYNPYTPEYDADKYDYAMDVGALEAGEWRIEDEL